MEALKADLSQCSQRTCQLLNSIIRTLPIGTIKFACICTTHGWSRKLKDKDCLYGAASECNNYESEEQICIQKLLFLTEGILNSVGAA